MTELLPCPFCGGEAATHEVTFPYHYWDVWCDGECFDHFCEKPTEVEAIKAWNTRAERTCENVSDDISFACSACGSECYIDWEGGGCGTPRFCPNCGAKVMN